MSRGLTLIKLGGSVVTYKNLPLKPNITSIKRLSQEISESGIRELVIIHGGGSYGHYEAHRLSLMPPKPGKDRIAICNVMEAMDDLTLLISRYMHLSDLPVVPFPTYTYLETLDSGIFYLNLLLIEEAIRLGFIPLLRGDVVFDKSTGYTIASGDLLVTILATSLNVQRVILCISEDGVIGEDGKVISLYSFTKPPKLASLPSSTMDVTGGLDAKLSYLKPVAKNGVEILIINGLKENRLLNALKGDCTLGTKVVW
ncbi:MAG TPA: hypothetical protein ENF41_04765 [Candidatus Bathyarchaeota archaeon]|nr:hypothetical protein [Candidatus Bathyarchaeota archaeon]